jgi:hypothetical protein
MALDTGNYISDFDRANPTASDPVSEGDDVLRFVKKVLQKTFPMGTDAAGTATGVGPNQAVQVIIAKATDPIGGGNAAESMGLVWLDTTLNLLKIRNQANNAWITLAIDPEASNSVDVNAGTIDGAVIGGAVAAAVTTTDLTATTADINAGTIDGTIIGSASAAAVTTTDLTATTADINAGTVDAVLGATTPAAVTGTTLKANTSLELATGATVTGIDNGALGASAVLLATQGAVKTYVDAQVGAADLDITTDSGTIDIDLDDDTLSVLGGSGLNSSATGTTVTIAGDDASTSAKGVASFSSSHFSVSSGAVSIATDSIDDTLIDFGTGANQVSTADVPEETNLYYTNTRADARIAAASVGDLDDVLITSIANDQVLRYSTITSKWENETSVTPDQLDTIGQLVAYNGGSGEEAFDMPGSANGKVLTADSTATYGFDWTEVADNAAAMALALGG